MSFESGQRVRTPLGTGIVVEIRNKRSVTVRVGERLVTFPYSDVTAAQGAGPKRSADAGKPKNAQKPGLPLSSSRRIVVDLHGRTVEEALHAMMSALDRALLADAGELHLIHGRRGDRIRRAVHARLAELSPVRAYRLDPRNAGVTIVQL